MAVCRLTIGSRGRSAARPAAEPKRSAATIKARAFCPDQIYVILLSNDRAIEEKLY